MAYLHDHKKGLPHHGGKPFLLVITDDSAFIGSYSRYLPSLSSAMYSPAFIQRDLLL
ncbi:hypothetical protein [Plesiomonas sp.]|uniref:hypothetical protein n=1 Tax=Plesiomonas sp. TaxID=2486279 RepID=UPI003F2F56DC